MRLCFFSLWLGKGPALRKWFWATVPVPTLATAAQLKPGAYWSVCWQTAFLLHPAGSEAHGCQSIAKDVVDACTRRGWANKASCLRLFEALCPGCETWEIMEDV